MVTVSFPVTVASTVSVAVTVVGPATVKVKRLEGAAPVASPEFEVCAQMARRHDMPLLEVYRVVQREAEERLAKPR